MQGRFSEGRFPEFTVRHFTEFPSSDQLAPVLGLLWVEALDGSRWTRITNDVGSHLSLDISPGDIDIHPDLYPVLLKGWPDDWNEMTVEYFNLGSLAQAARAGELEWRSEVVKIRRSQSLRDWPIYGPEEE
jgi:hypothetical protein